MELPTHPDLAQATPRKTGCVSKRKGTDGINGSLFFPPIYNKQQSLWQNQLYKVTVYTRVGDTIPLDVYADLVI